MGTTRTAGWIAAMGMLAACAETTVGTAVDPATFAAVEQEALCRRELRCPHNGAGIFGDVAGCVAYQESNQGFYRRDLAQRVRAGRVRFDTVAARRCLDVIEGSCGAQTGVACTGVYVGDTAAGQSCEIGYECGGGLYCDFGDATAPTCPGRCLATRTPPGEVGTPWESCRPDPGAAPYIENGRCYSVTRGATAAVGAPCGLVPEGRAGHLLSVDCAEGLACAVTSRPMDTRCGRVVAAGDACVDGDVCAAGFTCVGGRCGPLTGITRAVGGPCTIDRTPGGPTCDPLLRLTCGRTGHCVSVGDGSDGSGCLGGPSTHGLCNEGLYCDGGRGDIGACRALHTDGASCASDVECRSGACRGGVCVTPRCW